MEAISQGQAALLQELLEESRQELAEGVTVIDRDTFTRLYDENVDQVYRHVHYRMPDQAVAEDITQEAFLRAWKSIDRYRNTGAPFAAWLNAIADNLVADHHRGRKKLAPMKEADRLVAREDSDPQVLVQSGLDWEQVRGAVKKLKGDKARVITMRFVDGFSYSEIARALRKTEGAVRVIQYRALNDLRRMLVPA